MTIGKYVPLPPDIMEDLFPGQQDVKPHPDLIPKTKADPDEENEDDGEEQEKAGMFHRRSQV